MVPMNQSAYDWVDYNDLSGYWNKIVIKLEICVPNAKF